MVSKEEWGVLNANIVQWSNEERKNLRENNVLEGDDTFEGYGFLLVFEEWGNPYI